MLDPVSLATRALRGALTVLTFGITIPVGVILLAALWVHFDKGSSVRSAVDRAVIELVAGAELEAANARADAQAKIIAELRTQSTVLELANDRFAERLRVAEVDLENANDEIQDLVARPVSDSCTVGVDLLERLRNN